ncbi:hypothetical protein J6590_044312 [Homalodisca vitripennis]|nr:hypothetical protein J6590_044312 [Homalodisca vitripennis]
MVRGAQYVFNKNFGVNFALYCVTRAIQTETVNEVVIFQHYFNLQFNTNFGITFRYLLRDPDGNGERGGDLAALFQFALQHELWHQLRSLLRQRAELPAGVSHAFLSQVPKAPG